MKFVFVLMFAALSACGHPADKKASEPVEDPGYDCNECECDEDGDCFCTGCTPPDGSCCEDGCDGDDCSMGACDCDEDCDCGCGDEDDGDETDVDHGGDGGCSGGTCNTMVYEHLPDNSMGDWIRCL